MAREEWRDAPEWEGIYQVSSLGRVRRITHFRKVGEGLFEPSAYKPIAVCVYSDSGYHYTRFSNGRAKTMLMHRLLCWAFHGPPPAPDSQVGHWDGNPGNNDLSNLRWVSPLENAQDRRRHMRDALGSDHTLSKLTDADVREIRRRHVKRYGAGIALAREFNVTNTLISNIVLRKTWKHI